MSDESAQLEVARPWFAIDMLDESVIRISEPNAHELIRANAFLVKGRDRDLLIDSGLGIASLRQCLADAGLIDKEITAVATHAHYDHVGSIHEFDERLIHPAEADDLAGGTDEGTLSSASFTDSFREVAAAIGLPLPELLITALPHLGYDPAAYRLHPAEPTGLLEEGATLDLGDRRVEVLHLPGHSPGGIGLYDPDAQMLFSGDAIYDGPLIDEGIPGTDIRAYVATMRRLEQVPVAIVHPGHYESFDQGRMREIAADYLRRRDSGGAP